VFEILTHINKPWSHQEVLSIPHMCSCISGLLLLVTYLYYFVDILSKWPLFGSSFFAVKRVSDPKERSDHILALNRHGVHFIDLITHVSIKCYVSHFVSEYVQIWSQNNIWGHIVFLNRMSLVDLRNLCYSVPNILCPISGICTSMLVHECFQSHIPPLVLFVTYKCNFSIGLPFCHRLNREHLVYVMLVLKLQ
jgi:hypothetical protein